jgi:hypothetical protein
MVTLTISILYVSSGVIGAVENYKKGNNIAGGTTPSYGNMTINQGYEKDGDRGSYLQGGYAAP